MPVILPTEDFPIPPVHFHPFNTFACHETHITEQAGRKVTDQQTDLVRGQRANENKPSVVLQRGTNTTQTKRKLDGQHHMQSSSNMNIAPGERKWRKRKGEEVHVGER